MDYQVQPIDPLKDPRWDRFVQTHPLGWVCHLSGWKKVLEESFKHMKGYYFVLLDSSGTHIQAGLPVFHVRSWLLGNRLVSIPFATYCDPLTTTAGELKLLLDAVKNLKRKLGCSSIEIKTNRNSNFSNNSFGKQIFFLNHYIDLRPSLEEIFKSFHRKTVRQSINRSMKFNLKICQCTENEIDNFYPLYVRTRKKIGLPPMPFKFFNNLWIHLTKNDLLDLYLIKENSTVVSALICLKFKNRASAEVMGWNAKYGKICPNHFLYWNVIKDYKENAYEIFDFGRTHINNSALIEYKKRWGTISTDLPQFFYPSVISKSPSTGQNSTKYKLVKNICTRMPNCTQRLIGEFCYRHLG